MFAIYAQLQAWVVGVPVLVVLNNGDNADAVFLGRALLIWVFSISGVASVVGRKLYKAIMQRMYPEHEGNVHISGTIGLSTVQGSSRSSYDLALNGSRSSIALRKSAFKKISTASKYSSSEEATLPDNTANDTSIGSMSFSLDALHSSIGNSRFGEGSGGSNLFSLTEVENSIKAERLSEEDTRDEGGESDLELDESAKLSQQSKDNVENEFEKSAELSVVLFSLSEGDESDADGGSIRDASQRMCGLT